MCLVLSKSALHASMLARDASGESEKEKRIRNEKMEKAKKAIQESDEQYRKVAKTVEEMKEMGKRPDGMTRGSWRNAVFPEGLSSAVALEE